MQTFAQQLSALRKERGVTQEQLAQELNVSRTTISRWESGKVLPDIESIKRLSQVLNYNFFTVEGLGQDLPVAQDLPAAQETPVEQEPAEKKKGPARWIMAGAAALIILCVAMALLLGGRTSPAELVAASTGKAFLVFAPDGGLRWDMVFTFENTGEAAFIPDGADYTCFENDASVFNMTLSYEELKEYMAGSSLIRGGQPLELPFGSNMLNMTSVVCRVYGKDEHGNPHEASSTVELVRQTEQAMQTGIQEEEADAAHIVVTTSTDVATLEPFFDDGFGWNVNFYFENTTAVPFRPDGVETLIYENDEVVFTSFMPYEDLKPHMSNGMLYQGSIPLHYPVGVNLLNCTHVYCRIFGTDDNGNPIDAGKTVLFSHEYKK